MKQKKFWIQRHTKSRKIIRATNKYGNLLAQRNISNCGTENHPREFLHTKKQAHKIIKIKRTISKKRNTVKSVVLRKHAMQHDKRNLQMINRMRHPVQRDHPAYGALMHNKTF
jgi:hypothetical protein